MSGGRDWPAAAGSPLSGEEDDRDVEGAERELELALAGFSEIQRFRLAPHEARVMAEAFDHAKRAHRMIFRARWLGAA